MTAARASFVSVALLVAAAPRPAAAQSRVERVSDDACERARAYDVDDDSLPAQQAFRQCRLQSFETRLAVERQEEVQNQIEARDARVQAWLDATQPIRALRPFAVSGFLGTGLATYGLVGSWNVLRGLELDARIGWRAMTCWDQYSSMGADCTRRAIGVGARWLIGSKDFAPFFSAGMTYTGSHLQIIDPNPGPNSNGLLVGDGRANSASIGGGLQLSARWLRLTVEYVYEDIFYTGASVPVDRKVLRNEDLRVVWRDSLMTDRHGFRFEAGYAF